MITMLKYESGDSIDPTRRAIRRDTRRIKPIQFAIIKPELSFALVCRQSIAELLVTVPTINTHPDEMRKDDPWWSAPLNVKVQIGPMDV